LESNPPMSWKAASSFPFKVNRPAPSERVMASRYRLRHRTLEVSLAPPRVVFSSPMSWRRGSLWRLQLNYRDIQYGRLGWAPRTKEAWKSTSSNDVSLRLISAEPKRRERSVCL